VLGRAILLVRFPLMSVEEFAQGPAQSGLLSDRELVALFLYFTVNPKPAINFLDSPRCCMMGKELTINRFKEVETRWGYSGTSDRIRFSVDKKIYVIGFGLYGSIHGPAEYSANVEIIHTVSGRVIASNNVSYSTDGFNYTFRVMFKQPVEIMANSSYIASVTIKASCFDKAI
jgi:BTB/POZ domain-containing protein 1/2